MIKGSKNFEMIINSKKDQSWESQYIQFMQKEKIIRKGKKLFTPSNESVVGKKQNKMSNPEVMGEGDIKKLSNVNSH